MKVSKMIKNIKMKRLDKRMSQQSMAAELGISQAGYSKLEADRINLTVRQLLKIAEVLEVHPYDLMKIPRTRKRSRKNLFSKDQIILINEIVNHINSSHERFTKGS